jgi:hypothetical protein
MLCGRYFTIGRQRVQIDCEYFDEKMAVGGLTLGHRSCMGGAALELLDGLGIDRPLSRHWRVDARI